MATTTLGFSLNLPSPCLIEMFNVWPNPAHESVVALPAVAFTITTSKQVE